LSHDVSLLPVNLNQPSHQESLNDSSDAEHPIHGDAQFVLAGIAACTGLWLQVRGHEAIGRRSRIKGTALITCGMGLLSIAAFWPTIV